MEVKIAVKKQFCNFRPKNAVLSADIQVGGLFRESHRTITIKTEQERRDPVVL